MVLTLIQSDAKNLKNYWNPGTWVLIRECSGKLTQLSAKPPLSSRTGWEYIRLFTRKNQGTLSNKGTVHLLWKTTFQQWILFITTIFICMFDYMISLIWCVVHVVFCFSRQKRYQYHLAITRRPSWQPRQCSVLPTGMETSWERAGKTSWTVCCNSTGLSFYPKYWSRYVFATK